MRMNHQGNDQYTHDVMKSASLILQYSEISESTTKLWIAYHNGENLWAVTGGYTAKDTHISRSQIQALREYLARASEESYRARMGEDVTCATCQERVPEVLSTECHSCGVTVCGSDACLDEHEECEAP